jgi:DNA-binding response OmpR family regulator
MRVLVVEPTPPRARLLAERLRQVGLTVDIAPDAAPALVAIADGPRYDVVVVDVAPPAREGAAAVRALRARNPRIALLLLTGASVAERVQGLDLGADDCLATPFAVEELLARIRALLRPGPLGHPAVLRVADLTLDPATRRVRRSGRAIAGACSRGA